MRSRRRVCSGLVPKVVSVVMVCTLLSSAGVVSAEQSPSPDRLVHRFLRVAVSPNGAFVASIEGDSPSGGHYPTVRELVIRRVRGGATTTIALPCGRTPQCWPGSPSWTQDSKRISFALRTPEGHSYAIYSVAPDGSGLTKLIALEGTINELHYGPDGQLAMLATVNAQRNGRDGGGSADRRRS
jgi:hypothetical protein